MMKGEKLMIIALSVHLQTDKSSNENQIYWHSIPLFPIQSSLYLVTLK